MITKDKLIYDESDLQNSDQVGANIIGSSGTKHWLWQHTCC